MDSNLKTLFYLKKPRNFTSDPIPIYLRITIDLLPKELSTGYSCLAQHWDLKTKRVKNIAAEDAKTNDVLTHLEDKVKNNYRYLREMDPDLVITSCELKDRLKGKIPKAQTLLGLFREHNAKVKALVGRDGNNNRADNRKKAITGHREIRGCRTSGNLRTETCR